MELRNILVFFKTIKPADVAAVRGVRLGRLKGAGSSKAYVPG